MTGGPLAGTRGIVLTQAWAGTYCTELLAFLGAEVIQIEVRKRLDSWRGTYDAPMSKALADVSTAEHPWNCSALYNSVNLNKRCITLDLQTDTGVDVFKRLLQRTFFAQASSDLPISGTGHAGGIRAVAGGNQLLHLTHQPRLQHADDSRIDACVELLPREVENHDHPRQGFGLERAVLMPPG